MKVKLINTTEADFNLSEDKCEKISHNLFRTLTNFECKQEVSTEPKMVVFKTKEEYSQNACKYDLDLEKDMFINSKGQIFCYLKQDDVVEQIESQDESTNTTENTGEQS